jgi:phosphocarrier protein FPr
MLQLESTNIEVGAEAAGKEDAIRQVAGLLVRSGCIAPGYAESMLTRAARADVVIDRETVVAARSGDLPVPRWS